MSVRTASWGQVIIDDGDDSYKWTYVPAHSVSDWMHAYLAEGTFWSLQHQRYMGCGIYTEWSPVTKENVQCVFPSKEGCEDACGYAGFMYVLFNTVTYTELYAAAFAPDWAALPRCSPPDESVAAVQPKTKPVRGGNQIEPSRPLDFNLKSADGNSKKLSRGQTTRARNAAQKEAMTATGYQ
jgi:hypothetical protein